MFPDSPSSFCPCSSLLLFLASSCHCLSVQFSCSVVSDSLRPHGLQHARLPCPLPTPRACSNSCPSLVMPSNHLILCRSLLLEPSIFPSIRVFSNESVLHNRCQRIGASASVLPVNIQDCFPLGFTGLISLQYVVFITSLAIGPRVAAVWLLPLPFYWKYSKVSGDNKPLL